PGEDVLLDQPSVDSSERDAVQIYGGYLALDHLRVTNENISGQDIWVDYNAHDITISNCEIFGGHGQGILVSGNRATIYRNHIHHNGTRDNKTHGIYLEGSGNVVRSNVVNDNWANGIQLYRGESGVTGNNLIEYNYIYHNGYGSTGLDSSKLVAG